MRIARFDGGKTGIVVQDGTDMLIVDLAASIGALPQLHSAAAEVVAGAVEGYGKLSWESLIANWDLMRPGLDALSEAAVAQVEGVVVRRLDEVVLGPPLPSMSARYIAMGSNFVSHMVSAAKGWKRAGLPYPYTEDPEETYRLRSSQGPSGFHVFPETIVGTGDRIVPPRGLTKIDYEGEIAVILQQGGRDIPVQGVRFWGYTPWNDFSLRDGILNIGPAYDRGLMHWALQKNFDTGNSCGPWVLIDEQANLTNLRIRTWVNGDLRQDGNTKEMVFGFSQIVSHLSHFVTLRSGDVIVSGTPAGTAVEQGPEGPFLKDGDVVEIDVTGVGALLRNEIAMPQEGLGLSAVASNRAYDG